MMRGSRTFIRVDNRADCSAAVETAATLEGIDRGVFDSLAADPGMHDCMVRSCAERRRVQLERARNVASDSQRVVILRDLPACNR
jgi:hypothetical protein